MTHDELPAAVDQWILKALDNPVLLARAQWFETDWLNVYLRFGTQYLQQANGEYEHTPCITVANVTARKQGRGIYRAFLALVAELAVKYGVAQAIENVLVPEHYPIYLRRGFTHCKEVNIHGHSFFYKLKESNEQR